MLAESPPAQGAYRGLTGYLAACGAENEGLQLGDPAPLPISLTKLNLKKASATSRGWRSAGTGCAPFILSNAKGCGAQGSPAVQCPQCPPDSNAMPAPCTPSLAMPGMLCPPGHRA